MSNLVFQGVVDKIAAGTATYEDIFEKPCSDLSNEAKVALFTELARMDQPTERTGVKQRGVVLTGQVGSAVVFDFATDREDATKDLRSWGFVILENSAADDVTVDFDPAADGGSGQPAVITQEGVSYSSSVGPTERITCSPTITIEALPGASSSVQVLVFYEETQF